ncbi:GNAT family N-acetyltransferase [Qipengyuania nanhaisediminis]|uniref:GNAT family N-acetyltransferase n=1 Tax=Qipengyuania nanhaisediminis TaxID=604088 RepID=UPI0038B294F7
MTRAYRHLPPLECERGDYAIRCVESDDIEAIRYWRNSQMEVLRQREVITAEAQTRYFKETIWPQMNEARPNTILVTVLYQGERIGYGGLVHCAWAHRRAEISILFDPAIAARREKYRSALLAFLDMIGAIGFGRLGFNRLTLETYAFRSFHIRVLEEAGYACEGRLREHVSVGGRLVDSLLHARLASDHTDLASPALSSATRSIRVPAGGGS